MIKTPKALVHLTFISRFHKLIVNIKEETMKTYNAHQVLNLRNLWKVNI